jgi:hypothetical protein
LDIKTVVPGSVRLVPKQEPDRKAPKYAVLLLLPFLHAMLKKFTTAATSKPNVFTTYPGIKKTPFMAFMDTPTWCMQGTKSQKGSSSTASKEQWPPSGLYSATAVDDLLS